MRNGEPESPQAEGMSGQAHAVQIPIHLASKRAEQHDTEMLDQDLGHTLTLDQGNNGELLTS